MGSGHGDDLMGRITKERDDSRRKLGSTTVNQMKRIMELLSITCLPMYMLPAFSFLVVDSYRATRQLSHGDELPNGFVCGF